jgi:hypothetical protein
MAIAVLGVDLSRNICSVVGPDASGAVVMRRKVRRETLIAFGGEAPSVRCRNGGVLRRSSSGSRVRRSRPRRSAHVARIRPPLCQGAKER